MSASPYKFVVFTCINERPIGNPKGCCHDKGSKDIHVALKRAAGKLGLKDVRFSKSGCLNLCEYGANIVVFGRGNPDGEGVWYKQVSVEDAEEIVQSHLIDGKPVARLLNDFAPVKKDLY